MVIPNNMTDIQKNFCKDVLDVEYLSYSKNKKIFFTEASEYIDLQALYCFNHVSIKESNMPYVKLDVDADGRKFASLTSAGFNFSRANELTFIPKPRNNTKNNNLSLFKVKNHLQDESEESIYDYVDKSCNSNKTLEYVIADTNIACRLEDVSPKKNSGVRILFYELSNIRFL